MTIKLTPAQQRLLQRAGDADGPIEVLPEAMKTAQVLAREKLLKKGRGHRWTITQAGHELLEPPSEPSIADARKAPREGSKAALVIALLKRHEGATVDQLSEATGWLPHSVRGFMAGALRRKYDVTLTSEKSEAGRIYRIEAAG